MKYPAQTALNHEKFQNDLIEWYQSECRDLPWRKDRDPYKIWVSEVMLQQTRVDTVVPYFKQFMSRFPTVRALAEADEAEVLKAWEGLGYYSRARNLQSGVREVYEKYDAKVPDNKKEISGLKGVGPYTAGAILSIAYGIPEPAVDGNVMRVLSRILLIEEDIAKPKTRKMFEKAAGELISEAFPSEFNQGLMELGAVVCTPKSPKCLLCPVQEHCAAFAEGRQEDLPKKSRKKPPKLVPMAVAVVKNEHGQVLIHRRPQEGLLAGLWEFPGFEVSADGNKKKELTELMAETYGFDVNLQKRLRNIQHVFTHLKWELAVYEGTANGPSLERGDLKFVSPGELQQYPFPVSHQKIMQMLQEEENQI
ncbi:MAG TPA: A/G-specific adenine glycosylase [Bacillales bacterium]|nr:A/G-specific adenine glycosylase [Bacillales bacterium]